MVCAFFGHRDAPADIAPLLRETIIRLIVKRGITTFFVGNQGSFDRLVIHTLFELTTMFSHLSVTVVLSCLPTKPLSFPDGVQTLFPAEVATPHHDTLLTKLIDG